MCSAARAKSGIVKICPACIMFVKAVSHGRRSDTQVSLAEALACSRLRTSSKGGRFSGLVSQHSTIRSWNGLDMCSGMVGRHPISTLKNTCACHAQSVLSSCLAAKRDQLLPLPRDQSHRLAFSAHLQRMVLVKEVRKIPQLEGDYLTGNVAFIQALACKQLPHDHCKGVHISGSAHLPILKQLSCRPRAHFNEALP